MDIVSPGTINLINSINSRQEALNLKKTDSALTSMTMQ